MIHMLLPGTKTATSATIHPGPDHGSSDQMGETLRASDCAMRTMIAKDENTFCTESHVPCETTRMWKAHFHALYKIYFFPVSLHDQQTS
jgi:hypothetical protein